MNRQQTTTRVARQAQREQPWGATENHCITSFSNLLLLVSLLLSKLLHIYELAYELIYVAIYIVQTKARQDYPTAFK
jgi:hypothetical protein